MKSTNHNKKTTKFHDSKDQKTAQQIVEHILSLKENEGWTLEYKFNCLHSIWNEYNKFKAFHDINHPAFWAIVGFNKEIIPIILKTIKKEHSWIFMVLFHITNENPIPKEHRGNIENMIKDWLQWGIENNYIIG